LLGVTKCVTFLLSNILLLHCLSFTRLHDVQCYDLHGDVDARTWL